MTSPTDEEWKRLSKLVDSFYNRADAQPFREPVPWEELGLIDYPKMISCPMDLGTIRDRIRKRKYGSFHQCHADVTTVWRNCMTYNADGSDFYKLADTLRRRWDDKFNKLVQDVGMNSNGNNGASSTSASAAGGGEPMDAAGGDVASGGGESSAGAGAGAASSSNNGASSSSSSSSTNKILQDRRTLAKSLFQIGKEDLGLVLQEVERKSPGALKRNSAEDEIEFNLDELSVTLVHELIARVNQMKASGGSGGASGGKKTKKATGTSAGGSGGAATSSGGAGGGGAGTASSSNKKAKVAT